MAETHPYQQTAASVLAGLQSRKGGLSNAEARERLLRDGANVLVEKPPRTILQMVAGQLKDVMVYLLLAATVISFALGETTDAIIILLVVVMNTIIGVVQESKAETALEALKKLSSPTAMVRRDGRLAEIPAADLVAGDIVLLDAGRVVPADLRLLKSVNLKVDESALTGESVPSEKDAAFVADGEQGIGDRHNMVFSSTSPDLRLRHLGCLAAFPCGRDAQLRRFPVPPAPLLKQDDGCGVHYGAAAAVCRDRSRFPDQGLRYA